MAKLKSIKTDARREEDGVWVDYAAGIRLKVARLTNSKYLKFMRQQGKEHRAQIKHGVLDDEVLEGISKRGIAKHVLLDWENVEDDDGKPIKYTPEVGEETLEDPEYRDLLFFVIEIANNRDLFLQSLDEDDLGNSSKSSTGSSSSASTSES